MHPIPTSPFIQLNDNFLHLYATGTSTGFETPSLDLNGTATYLISVRATNRAGLGRLLLSEVSVSESNVGYGGTAKVVVNYARYENVTGVLEEVERLVSGEEFVCLLETDFVTIEFDTPPSATQPVDTERCIYNIYIHYQMNASIGTEWST